MKPGGVVPVLLLAANFLNAQGLSPNTNLNAREEQIIAAAKPGAAPHFNGARVVGIRPGTPFLHSLAVSGERPVNFSANNLPAGLSLDSQTGIITGSLASLPANTLSKLPPKIPPGKPKRKSKSFAAMTLALTPPMGWNSYDAFGDNVVESEVLANARYVAEKLQPVGWDTVVVDYCWSDPGAHDNNRNARTDAPLAADNFGRLLPATNRFPSAADGAGFKPLADAVHALGLKFGIHVMRGIPRNSVKANLPIEGSNFTAAEAGNTNDKCVWCPDMFGVNSNAAGQAWYDSCARLWAAWGVDYIKVDDLSHRITPPKWRWSATRLTGADARIVFSTSPGETPPCRRGPHCRPTQISGASPAISGTTGNRSTTNSRSPDAGKILPGRDTGRTRTCCRSAIFPSATAPSAADRFTHFTRDEQLTHHFTLEPAALAADGRREPAGQRRLDDGAADESRSARGESGPAWQTGAPVIDPRD